MTLEVTSAPITPAQNLVHDEFAQQPIRLLFLGTGAADWPRQVDPDEVARPNNIAYRRLSAALVDDHILIDIGPTLPSSLTTFQIDPEQITDLVITHSHKDHVDAVAFETLLHRRRHAPTLRVWGHPAALGRLPMLERVEPHFVLPYQPFTVGNYEFEGLEANHFVPETLEQPLLYLIRRNGSQLFYATDGAWLPSRSWGRLTTTKLDAIIWDGTFDDRITGAAQFGHNSLAMVRMMTEALRCQKILLPTALVLLTHLSLKRQMDHHSLVQALLPDRIAPAYDGMVIQVGEQMHNVT